MSARLIIAACALLAAPVALAAASDDYAYAWPLQTSGDSAAWQVELTPEVYAAITRTDLRDIEIVNAAGEPVPLALRGTPAMSVTTEAQIPLPIFPLPASKQNAPAGDDTVRLHVERGADGRLRSLDAQVGTSLQMAPTSNAGHGALKKVDAASSADAGHAGLVADTANQRDLILDASAAHDPLSTLQILWDGKGENVSAQFSVDGSDDLQQWRSIVANASVLHLEQDGNVLERHGIALNETHVAYLRLHRLDDGAPLRDLHAFARMRSRANSEIAGVQWLQATPDGGELRYLSRAFIPADGKHTVAWRYHLPAPLTADAIRVSLADDNSLARIVAISRAHDPYDDPASWSQRGGYIAFRLRQDGTAVDNDDFPVMPANLASDWRIESATPLEHAPTLSIAYRPDRLVFLAQGGGPYRLVAGSARTQHGDYPIDTALAPLRARLGKDWQPPLATLGARTMLQGDAALKPAPTPAPRTDWRTWLLWAVLVGAAALIGGLALSLLRKPPPA